MGLLRWCPFREWRSQGCQVPLTDAAGGLHGTLGCLGGGGQSIHGGGRIGAVKMLEGGDTYASGLSLVEDEHIERFVPLFR